MDICIIKTYISQLDIGTVYAQPDHRFIRRWAVLTDPEETLGASGAGVKVWNLSLIITLFCNKYVTLLSVNIMKHTIYMQVRILFFL